MVMRLFKQSAKVWIISSVNSIYIDTRRCVGGCVNKMA